MKIEKSVIHKRKKATSAGKSAFNTGSKKMQSAAFKKRAIMAAKASAEKRRELKESTSEDKSFSTVDRASIKAEIRAEMKRELDFSFIKIIDPDNKGYVEIGGTERERHDANILRLEWVIKFPMLSPQEYLLHEKDYSYQQAKRILAVSGGEAEWRDDRDKLLNGVTDTMIKRNIDKMVENSETHIKLSQLGIAKIAEMLTKMQIDSVLDAAGKIMVDLKTQRPIYRGFRSMDLVNCMNALERAQQVQRMAFGLSNDVGIKQLTEMLTNTAQSLHFIIFHGVSWEKSEWSE